MKKCIPALTVSYLVLFMSISVYGQKKGKLTIDEKNNLRTGQVMLYRYEAPPLSFMTPKDAVGEGLVAKVTKSDDAEKHRGYDYKPTKLVQQKLDSLLRAQNLMTNIKPVEEAFAFQMPAELKDLSKYDGVKTDYIMEVIVPLMGWQASYSPARWKTYMLNLAVEVRLIKHSDNSLIWKTNVGHGGLTDARLKFHISELEENGKEKIAKMLDIAALECSKKVVEDYVKAGK